MSKKVKVSYSIDENLKIIIKKNAIDSKMRDSEYINKLLKDTLKTEKTDNS